VLQHITIEGNETRIMKIQLKIVRYKKQENIMA